MGFFTGDEIPLQTAKPMFPDVYWGLQQVLSDQLQGYGTNGRLQFAGLNAFNPANDPSGAIATAKDYLTIQPNANLQKAWNAWQPYDAGTQYLADYITNGKGPNPAISNMAQNMQQYGVMGGYPGDLMHNMAQYGAGSPYAIATLNNMMKYGGTGGLGNQGMSAAMQFGTPSQAGQFVNNMAQQGIASQGSGAPLQARAYGQANPSLSYLQPFMDMGARAAAYQTPSMPTRQLYRNVGNGPVRIAPPVGYNLPGV